MRIYKVLAIAILVGVGSVQARDAKELEELQPNEAVREFTNGTDLSVFEGTFRISGEDSSVLGHQEVLSIRRLHEPNTEFWVKSSSRNPAFENVFKEARSANGIAIVSEFEVEKCIHRIWIEHRPKTLEFKGRTFVLWVEHIVHENPDGRDDCPPGTHIGHVHGGGTGPESATSFQLIEVQTKP